jgi:hypothetical protein
VIFKEEPSAEIAKRIFKHEFALVINRAKEDFSKIVEWLDYHIMFVPFACKSFLFIYITSRGPAIILLFHEKINQLTTCRLFISTTLHFLMMKSKLYSRYIA